MRRRLLAINPVDHPGGAETTLLRLLDGLSRDGWSVELTTPGPGSLRDAATAAGYGWHPLAVGGLAAGQGLRALRSWSGLRRLAQAADAVLLNGAVCGRLLPALIPPAGPRRVKARVLLHVHDIVPRVPAFWKAADRIVAASAAVAAALPGLDARVVYPPVDPEPAPADPPWPLEESRPVVGFIGRLEPRKGPLDLVRAAPLIRRGAAEARIVLVGDDRYGSSPEYTRQVLAESSGVGAVEHYPWVVNAPGLMRHLDALVLPAYREPFGTVLAEAMAVGTPVVATPVDGLPEVVQDGLSGRLVPPGDPSALAEAVLDVLGRREAMGAAARRSAARFHTDLHVAQMEALLAA